MKYYWLLFEILEICLSDVSHLDAIALHHPPGLLTFSTFSGIIIMCCFPVRALTFQVQS